jgi:hypothetical protein
MRRYLELSSRDSEDRRAIEDYVRDLERAGHCP